ncbi:MAG: HIT domain-containing protein [Thermodesulfobacteriota bacterium]|nr:MAG: HIT domain-containing protein [Thermodesulfobacteriota bacterium]
MNRIWSPWRSEYIGADKPQTCILCDAPSKGPGSGFHVLFDGSVSLVMLNKYPYTGGHLMIAPLRHVANLEELSPEESIDLFRLMRVSTAALTSAFKPDGFNVGMNIGTAAGAGIDDHIHMHVVPRWEGDTNFMPVLSDTKVLSQHLDETFKRLKPLFERI